MLVILILALLALAGVWILRKPIADDLLADEMRSRGVEATYRSIGLAFARRSSATLSSAIPPTPT